MVIILEGPDEGGKTTLAHAIAGLAIHNNLQPQLVKSPAGKTTQWEEPWEIWVKIHEARAHQFPSHLYILDRVPEVSEPIYAYAHHRSPRYRHPIRGWAEFGEVFPIFCLPNSSDPLTITMPPESFSDHIDPFGNPIDHYLIRVLYDYTASMFEQIIPQTFFWDRYLDMESHWRSLVRNYGARDTRISVNTDVAVSFSDALEIGNRIYA